MENFKSGPQCLNERQGRNVGRKQKQVVPKSIIVTFGLMTNVILQEGRKMT